MKIYLYFGEYRLGFLEKCIESRTAKYLWVPDINEIEKADKKYFFNMSMFSLSKEPKIYDKIPCHFADNDVLLSRKDIIDKVGITPDDDLFTRLYKLSTLEETRIEFIIKNK